MCFFYRSGLKDGLNMKSIAIYVLIYDIIATAGNLFGSLIKKLVIKKSLFAKLGN